MGLGQHNLARLGEETFERLGDHEAVHFEGETLTSGALVERAHRLASGFAELGVAPGDRVVVMMSNSPEVPMIYGAVWRVGAVVTPALFLLSADDMKHIISSSEAVAVITSPEFLATVKTAGEGVDTLKWLIVNGPPTEDAISLADLEKAEPGEIVPRADEDLAALMFTGGTTGRAKGVMISHSNLWHAGRAAHEVSHIPGMTRNIVPLPLAHSYGLLVTAAGLHAEEPPFAVIQRWFDPLGFLGSIQEHKLQFAAVVPSMLQIMLGLPLEQFDLSSMMKITTGASPLAPDVAKEFMKRVPNIEIREGYGLTETTALVSANPFGETRLGSIGKPVSWTEVKTVDDEGNDLKGEPGELVVRSPMVMQGYWGVEQDDDALRDGWLYTGDIARIDEDGYIWILDRKKDLIIRGGFNVYPRDIEDVLLKHPAVALAGVVGKPDEKLGEEVVAFVQLGPGDKVTPEELIEFSKEHLGKYKYPREVRIVDTVPLTPVMKIDRKKLRTLL